VPIPYADYTTLKAGVNYYPDQSDNFFTPNDFPPCGVTFTAMQIMGHTEANQ
jgi:ribose transport system substrate-binding protein